MRVTFGRCAARKGDQVRLLPAVSLRSWPGRGRSLMAASSPSSTYRFRTLATVAGLTNSTSAISRSRSPWSALSSDSARFTVRTDALPRWDTSLTRRAFGLGQRYFILDGSHVWALPHTKNHAQVWLLSYILTNLPGNGTTMLDPYSGGTSRHRPLPSTTPTSSSTATSAPKSWLIALLEEQRQAIINQAVTRGIDPKVNLKPSGAHWLGDVPEHWKMCRAKRLFSPRRELARPHDIQLSATQAFGVIPQDDYEQRVGRKVVKVSLHLDKRLHVEVDDFVISMRSFQGGLERAWSTGCIRSSYVILRPTSDVDVGFFTYLFKSQAYIQAIQSTGDFIRDGQDLNFNNFCAVDLPLPPAQEQGQIAAALQIATDNIDTNISGMRRQIHLMREYRTRLITDVVTGQLDVRDATVELPD